MNCRDVRRALPALIDRQLPAHQAAAVQQHLAECPDCARIYQEYRQDAQLLQTFVRSAPYRPVAREVRLRTQGRRPAHSGWSTLAQGGYRLATGLALVALVALVTLSALALRQMAQSTDPVPTEGATASIAAFTETATIAADQTNDATMMSAEESTPERILAALDDAGLVSNINQTVEVAGQQVQLLRLGVDRDVTLLEYQFPNGNPVPLHFGLIDDLGNQLEEVTQSSETASSGTHWVQFDGVDPAASEVSIRFEVTPGAGAVEDLTVPVDLTAIQQLPEPYELSGTVVRTAGVSVEVVSVRPGFAVSEIELQATVVDQTEMRLVDWPAPGSQPQGSLLATPIAIWWDGQLLPLFNHWTSAQGTAQPGVGAGSNKGWDITAQVFGRVESGTLRTTLERIQLDPSRSSSQYALGPWTNEAVVSKEQPEPVQTPVVTATPMPTPTAVKPTPTPAATPTPDKQPVQVLPRDVYFLADNGNGIIGLWVQPADLSAARLILDPPSSIAEFNVIPNSDLIAYRLEGEQAPVQLIQKDGRAAGEVRNHEGQPVAEYVVAPVDTRIAYVSLDRMTLWVSAGEGEPFEAIYQVPMPEIDSIREVTWSPDGQYLVLETSRLAQGGGPPPMVIDTQGTLVWQASRPVLEIIWSPDSQNLLYSVYGGIYRVDLADKAEVEITPPQVKDETGNRLFYHLAWLPDGRIGFTRHADTTVFSPAELWLMNRNGDNAWRPQADLGAVLDIDWTATDSGYGFVIGQADGGSGAEASPGELRYYPVVEQKPVRLAPEVTVPSFLQVEWE